MSLALTSLEQQFSLFEGRRSNSSELLRRQRHLLRRCIENELEFENELANAGLDYDDLRYEVDFDGELSGERFFGLSDFVQKESTVPVVSFFSGCGGLDLGFEAAGFRQAASVEINELFCETLKLNRPHWKVIGPPQHIGDVSDREVTRDSLRSVGIESPFEGVFIGGPPCQPFSIAANQRFAKAGKNFKRIGYAHKKHGNLLFDYVWSILAFKPRAFVLENVAGLIQIDGGQQFKRAMKLLSSVYEVQPPLLLNAANYLVPQNRCRLFIVGARKRKDFTPPTPSSTIVPCGRVFASPTRGISNHETRKHKAESILRYMKLQYGERDPLGRVDRLNPMLPSKTVIAGGTAGGGRSHLHPHVPRTISARECARLQTFPDDYIFTGPPARQFTQIGNAVPPVLAAQIGIQVMRSFFE